MKPIIAKPSEMNKDIKTAIVHDFAHSLTVRFFIDKKFRNAV
jgi:hypothetical protein